MGGNTTWMLPRADETVSAVRAEGELRSERRAGSCLTRLTPARDKWARKRADGAGGLQVRHCRWHRAPGEVDLANAGKRCAAPACAVLVRSLPFLCVCVCARVRVCVSVPLFLFLFSLSFSLLSLSLSLLSSLVSTSTRIHLDGSFLKIPEGSGQRRRRRRGTPCFTAHLLPTAYAVTDACVDLRARAIGPASRRRTETRRHATARSSERRCRRCRRQCGGWCGANAYAGHTDGSWRVTDLCLSVL